MLTEYHNLFVGGVVRILVGCVVIFGLLPGLLLPALVRDRPWHRRAANFLASGAFIVLSVHILVLAKMYDGVTFAAVCLGIWSIRVWYSRSRESSHRFENAFANALRIFDVGSLSFFVRSGMNRLKYVIGRINIFHLMAMIILATVILMTGVIRLIPVWDHAAPFSVEYYETLEQVKQLQINQMYGEGYRVPLGLSIFAQTLSLSSQVNAAIVVHFLGAISSMLLAGSIAYVVYRATFSLQASIVGAALFGVFNHFLPMDLRHQVEADSLVLASAFALPALSFLAEYCIEPRTRTLVVVVAGLFCAMSINLFIGSFAITGAMLVLVAALLFAIRLPWLRGMRLMTTAGVVILLLGGTYFLFDEVLERDSLKNAVKVLMYDQHLNRYFSLYGDLPQVFVSMCAALFGVSVLISFWKHSDRSFHLHLFSWGVFGIALLLLVQYRRDEIAAIIPFSQVDFLLSILAAIALGNVVGWTLNLGTWVLRGFRTGGWMGDTWQILFVGASLWTVWLYSPLQAIKFEYTAEPDGFAKSLYLIEQRYMPYQWTVVSHRGTALSGMNRGRFLDYGFFYSRYNPQTYKHGTKDAIPTPVLFIFVERTQETTEVATELATTNRNSPQNIKQWLDTYQRNHHDLRIFYSDEKVVVYELEDSKIKALRG